MTLPKTVLVPPGTLPTSEEGIDPALQTLLSSELDAVFWPPARAGSISAWWGHVPFAHWLVSATQPRLIVELGTHYGVSYAAFCEAVLRAQLDSRCFAIDTWQGDEHAGHYTDEVYEDLRRFHDARYSQFSELIRTTFDDANEYFADSSIDLLHIDGLHTYEAAKHDFEKWLPKLSERGVVLFHDTNVREKGFGVWRLWAELRERYAGFEFLHGHGLGILAAGNQCPDPIVALCNPDTTRSVRVRERFEALGARWIGADVQRRLNAGAAAKDQELNAKDQDLNAKDQDLNAKDQVLKAFETRFADLSTHVAKADHQVDEQQAVITSLSKQLTDVGAALAAAHAHQAALEARLTAVLSSTSWKVTRPMRGVKRALLEPSFRRRIVRGLGKRVLSSAPLPSQLKARMLRRARKLEVPGLFRPAVSIYSEWVERYDTPSLDDIQAIERKVGAFPRKPLISVIVPVYNTDEVHLEEMIQSVRNQIYGNWELCIADDASTNPRVRMILERHQNSDKRIKVVYRNTNGHISAATNSALELATGEYIALLDHDDVLPRHALATVAEAIIRNPSADIFYSDEDKIDQTGIRYDPYFKPDWNEELLYGQNYISHLGVYRLDLVKRIGAFRVGYEGSQDYDLALRAASATTGPIIHIPHVLYHWRLFQGAQTFSSTQLKVASSAARRAIQDQLASKGERVSVTEAVGGYHRVVRDEPLAWPRVTAVIPTRDHVDILKECISGLHELTDYPNIEVIIADNDSIEDGTLEYFRQVQTQGVKVVHIPGEFNYSRINNSAIKHATGEIVLLLNNDISMIDRSWLKAMVVHLMHEKVAAVGAKLFYPDRTLQHGGVVLGMGGVAGHVHLGTTSEDPGYFARLMLPQDVACVTAACMAVKKSVFEEIGGFDERNLSVAFNDVDLCIRIRKAGYRIIWTPYAQLLHHESKSRGSDLEGEKRKRFEREVAYMENTWRDILTADPFYNPNLSLERCTPQLAFPPRVERPWN
jgi:GT2 family glycosyltransferase